MKGTGYNNHLYPIIHDKKSRKVYKETKLLNVKM